MSEMSGVLDLSGADTSGFTPLPSGSYEAAVYDAEWRKTKGGPDAAMPADTPYLNVQLKVADITVDGTEYKNRRVFTKYFPIVPEGYDAEKGAKNKGGFVKFLIALGYDEKKIQNGKFNLDIEDLKGKECTVVVSQKEWPKESGEYQNEVKGVKAAGSASGGASSGLI